MNLPLFTWTVLQNNTLSGSIDIKYLWRFNISTDWTLTGTFWSAWTPLYFFLCVSNFHPSLLTMQPQTGFLPFNHFHLQLWAVCLVLLKVSIPLYIMLILPLWWEISESVFTRCRILHVGHKFLFCSYLAEAPSLVYFIFLLRNMQLTLNSFFFVFFLLL